MNNETITTDTENVIEALHQTALYADSVPTIGLVVAGITLQIVGANDHLKHASAWVKGSGLMLLMAYFVHQYIEISPYDGGEFVVIGFRCIGVLGIYLPIATLIDRLLRAFKSWRLSKCSQIGNWRANRKQKREERQKEQRLEEERRQVEWELANQPEPLSDEEAFKQAMQHTQDTFARECEVITNNPYLDEFESESAIDQARAKMTRRIGKIMQGEY